MQNSNAHAYPIKLIDRVVSVENGVKASAIKNVSFNEKILWGHFPNNPIYPGIYIVEGLCQTAQLILNLNEAVTAKLEKFKFKSPVLPGDQIQYDVQLQENLEGFYIFKATALVNGKAVVTGEVTGRGV